MPFGLTRDDDPITYDVLRGAPGLATAAETLENVPVHAGTQEPNYLENPVRNMRMILSRRGLLARKGAQEIISKITDGQLTDSVHVPMEHTDRVFWQEVMRQNTVIPPLRRLTLEQYIRVLMYGEAVQMGAAIGAIGRPYVEYFSDPFITGLEDENANLLYHILQQLAWGRNAAGILRFQHRRRGRRHQRGSRRPALCENPPGTDDDVAGSPAAGRRQV